MFKIELKQLSKDQIIDFLKNNLEISLLYKYVKKWQKITI
jgi:hypothetical protein